MLSVGILIVALAGAGIAISTRRHSVADAMTQIRGWPLLASAGVALLGIVATFGLWREILNGFEVPLPWTEGARLFFTTQLGKYLPGSVWPTVLQMEAGRRYGATRATMLAANLVTIVLGSTVGLLVAAAVLPFYDAGALRHYWWALAAVPFLGALLHPTVIGQTIKRLSAMVRRPNPDLELDLRSEARGILWSLASWGALGLHIGLLAMSVGRLGPSVLLLSIGGMSLAVSLGILFIPAPVGVGLRDVVLGLVLSRSLTAGQTLVVVVGSRAILVVCDVVAAALAWVISVGRAVPAGGIEDSPGCGPG